MWENAPLLPHSPGGGGVGIAGTEGCISFKGNLKFSQLKFQLKIS